MKKQLKFRSSLVPLVLSGEKNSTWRLWDDKNLQEGDVLDLIEGETGRQFGTAKIRRAIEKSLGGLTEDERERVMRNLLMIKKCMKHTPNITVVR